MKKYIAILEDESERITVMKKLLLSTSSDYDIVFFDNTPEMLDWLKQWLTNTILICLDHDLGPDRLIKGQLSDPGTGKDIAYYLETQKPTCPVIIHTTNSFGRDAMKFTLQDVGWDTTVIRPSAEISWINDSWFNAVSKALKKTELSKDFLFFEKETGLILPECIKEMYNQFGNGGFGPYDDFMGLTSGHTDDLGNTVLNLYQSYLESDPESPSWNWPKKLLPVCHLGCSMYACLDISQSTVPVLKFDPSGRTGPEATKEDWEGAFTELFSSLHEWIDSWSKKS